jgi:predicted dehydrogenase
LVDTVHGLAQVGDGALSIRASWNHLAPSDEVRVQAAGTQGVIELRTVFGFSPDRQRVGSPCIRLTQPDCPDWLTVLDTQMRQPVEFQAQLDAAFGRSDQSVLPAATALALAVRSVSLCDAFARSLATGESVNVCLS